MGSGLRVKVSVGGSFKSVKPVNLVVDLAGESDFACAVSHSQQSAELDVEPNKSENDMFQLGAMQSIETFTENALEASDGPWQEQTPIEQESKPEFGLACGRG